MAVDSYLHTFVPRTALEDPAAFDKAHRAAYGTTEPAVRGAALTSLVEGTRLVDGATLADRILEEAVAAEKVDTAADRLRSLQDMSDMILDVTLDPETTEVVGVHKRTSVAGPSSREVALTRRSLQRIPSGPAQNALSGGANPGSLRPGDGVVKIA